MNWSICRTLSFPILALLALVSFYPLETAIVWHLRHGFVLDLAGRKFTVPLRWTAQVNSENALFLKRPLTVYSEALEAWGSAEPITHPSPTKLERQRVYEKFPDAYRTKLVTNQYVVKAPFWVGTEKHESLCMQSFHEQRTDWLHTSCVLFDDTWSANFQGKAGDTNAFLHTVLGLPTQAAQP